MIRGGDVGRMPAAWAVGTVSLAVTAELLPRMSAASWWSWVVDRGMVVAPAALWVPGRPVVGAASLHGELVGMLERLGHRGDLTHPVSLWYSVGNLFSFNILGWLLVDPYTGAMWTLERDRIAAPAQ